MKKRVVGLVSATVASSMFLTACGNDSADGAIEASGDYAAEQVLNLAATAELPSMDPALATDAISFTVMNNVFEGLFRLGEGESLEDGVAKSHEVSEDGLTYTFNLREDARWSNGDPVTAHDFVFAWQRVVNPETGAQFANMMFDIKNAESIFNGELAPEELGVKAIDDHTLEVELNSIVPHFLELTTLGMFMPLNQSVIEEQGDGFALEADTNVYNGPFVLSNWDLGSGWQYQRNEKYWDSENVKLDEINVIVSNDTSTRVNLFQTGRLDRTTLTGQFIEQFRNDEGFETYSEATTFFIRMNQDESDLANTNLRRAIAMSFDKQALTDVILNDGSIPATGLLPEGLVSSPEGVDFREANGDLLVHDVDAAQEHWEKAQEELGVDAVELDFLVSDTDNARRMAEFLQHEIQSNLPGVTITIRQQPFAQLLELVRAGNYDMSMQGWGANFPDAMTFLTKFVTDGPFNNTGYSSEVYDGLIDQATGELLTDLDARWEALLEAERVLMEDAVIAPIYQRGTAFVQQPNVRNIFNHMFGANYSFKWAYIANE